MVETKQTKEDIARLKEAYVEYYEHVPVQKYAAMAIGRDEDTIVLWRKHDKDFSDRVDQARALWVRKKAAKVRAEFALERLEKEIFAERKEVKVDADHIDKILNKFGIGDAGEAEGTTEGTSKERT